MATCSARCLVSLVLACRPASRGLSSCLRRSTQPRHLWPPEVSVHRLASTPLRGVSSSAAVMAASPAAPLTGERDLYDGLIVDPASLPAEPEQFAAALRTSLDAWRAEGVRGIWVKIPSEKAYFIGHAVDAGFEFHHAEKDYVMLTCWLPESENKLPPNASHQVGVGAFVMDEQRRVLVVQELHGPLRGKGVWKMPTGLVQQGEDISEAAEREVLEETGVRARFDAVLAMRQAHGFAFGKSDMFFVVALKPEPGQEELVVQEDELVAASWMPLDEFLQIPFTATRPLFRQVYATCQAYTNGTYSGLIGRKLEAGTSERQDLLLFGETQAAGGESRAEEDAWIGLDGVAAGSS